VIESLLLVYKCLIFIFIFIALALHDPSLVKSKTTKGDRLGAFFRLSILHFQNNQEVLLA